MAWFWTALAFLGVVYLLQAWQRRNKRLPPGPTGFPIFGSLHLLGKFNLRGLHKLSQKYGPIMHMRLGLVPTIVVSSPQAAELFLKKHDQVFASRPPNEALKYISYGQKTLSFSQYGSYWRDMRKICTHELLSNLKINSSKSMRRTELGLLIESVKKAAKRREAVNIGAEVFGLTASMSCQMVFGKKYKDEEFDEKGFKAVIQEGNVLAGAPNLGNYIPFFSQLDLQGLTRRMKACHKAFDQFFEKILNEHLQSKDDEERTKDFVDVLLGLVGSEAPEYRIDRSHIKAIMADILTASMDTSAISIEWAMSELIKHPRIMKKLQKELEDIVGLERMVEESDLDKLEYLYMVVKENFRLHPVTPLLLPRQASEDCTVNGFHIPKKSQIFVNTWTIGRDPIVWTDAERFNPERFVGSEIDVWGREFQLLPFGSGRRSCPGIQLGLTAVRLVIAQLVHCFDWELPDGMSPAKLDMTEAFGLTCPRAEHLVAVPNYRLQI